MRGRDGGKAIAFDNIGCFEEGLLEGGEELEGVAGVRSVFPTGPEGGSKLRGHGQPGRDGGPTNLLHRVGVVGDVDGEVVRERDGGRDFIDRKVGGQKG